MSNVNLKSRHKLRGLDSLKAYGYLICSTCTYSIPQLNLEDDMITSMSNIGSQIISEVHSAVFQNGHGLHRTALLVIMMTTTMSG
jgi:hypothetical protein